MNHQHCITALRTKGAPDHLVGWFRPFFNRRWESRSRVTCRNQRVSLVDPLKLTSSSVRQPKAYSTHSKTLEMTPKPRKRTLSGIKTFWGSLTKPNQTSRPPKHLSLLSRGEHQILQTTQNISLAKLPRPDRSIQPKPTKRSPWTSWELERGAPLYALLHWWL